MATIGIFEAKTRLSEIVRQVEAGERFTITVHGEPKAQLVPIPAPTPAHSPEEVEAAYQRLRNPRIKGISHETIRAWIEEGVRDSILDASMALAWLLERKDQGEAALAGEALDIVSVRGGDGSGPVVRGGSQCALVWQSAQQVITAQDSANYLGESRRFWRLFRTPSTGIESGASPFNSAGFTSSPPTTPPIWNWPCAAPPLWPLSTANSPKPLEQPACASSARSSDCTLSKSTFAEYWGIFGD